MRSFQATARIMFVMCLAGQIAFTRSAAAEDALGGSDSSAPAHTGVHGPAVDPLAAPALPPDGTELPVEPAVAPAPISLGKTAEPKRWNWKASTVQSLEFTLVDHAFRLAMDP